MTVDLSFSGITGPLTRVGRLQRVLVGSRQGVLLHRTLEKIQRLGVGQLGRMECEGLKDLLAVETDAFKEALLPAEGDPAHPRQDLRTSV